MNPEESAIAYLIGFAHVNGWLAYHQRPARAGADGDYRTAIQGDKGFPDLVFVHPLVATVIFAEVKARHGKRRARSRPTPDQDRWLAALRSVAEKAPFQVRAYVWDWPDDQDEAERLLSVSVRAGMELPEVDRRALAVELGIDPSRIISVT